jgi:two-component system OmpR family response regulator
MEDRILIVDDEDDINLLFKMVLEDNGFKVDVFNDPLEALQNFTAGSYELLLLDIVMPSMNGFELYKKMRMIDNKCKVCFLTARKDVGKLVPRTATIENDIENCIIIKPVGNEELVKMVKAQL